MGVWSIGLEAFGFRVKFVVFLVWVYIVLGEVVSSHFLGFHRSSSGWGFWVLKCFIGFKTYFERYRLCASCCLR